MGYAAVLVRALPSPGTPLLCHLALAWLWPLGLAPPCLKSEGCHIGHLSFGPDAFPPLLLARFTICHKTEVMKNTLNPVWQTFSIPVRALCNGDYDR